LRGCKLCEAEPMVSSPAGTSHCLNENLRRFVVAPGGLICET